MRNRTIIALSFAALLTFAASLTMGCGGGSGDEAETEQASKDLSGNWHGDASVQIHHGGAACQYFAGQYPIQWTLTQLSPDSYAISDSGTQIATGTADNQSPQTVTIHFPDVVNYPPDIAESCLGSEVVTLTQLGENALSWSYEGTADCGSAGECHYVGSAELQR